MASSREVTIQIVIPGKVLGSGRITKEVTVSAFKISNSARNHVEEKGDFEYIRDLIEQNPEGENIQILV
ncbi:MAG: uL15 family ribosomal protein [Candidatus Nanohaloarchaea archaeon]